MSTPAEISHQQKVARWLRRLRRSCQDDPQSLEAIEGLAKDRQRLQRLVTRKTEQLDHLRHQVQERLGRHKLNRMGPGDKPNNVLNPYAQSLVDRVTDRENEKKAGEGLYIDPSRVNCNQHLG